MSNIIQEKNGNNSIKLRVSLWSNEREITLNFPHDWIVVECNMAGHDLPPLSSLKIQDAFENPNLLDECVRQDIVTRTEDGKYAFTPENWKVLERKHPYASQILLNEVIILTTDLEKTREKYFSTYKLSS